MPSAGDWETTRYVLPIALLQELSEEVLASNDAAVIENRLRQVVNFYGIYNAVLGYDASIWRARKCVESRPYLNIRDLQCPPPALTKSGRLNDPGKPLLYVSMSQFSVLEEIGAEPGDYVQSIGYILGTNKLRTAFVGEYTHVHRWGRAVFAPSATQDINRILREMDFEAGKAFVFTDAFLASLLRDPSASRDDYVRSRTVARLLFEKLPQLDAIAYQGVAIDGSCNMALRPEAAEQLLQIGSVFVCCVTRKYSYGLYDFELVERAVGHREDGTLIWQTPFVPVVPRKRSP